MKKDPETSADTGALAHEAVEASILADRLRAISDHLHTAELLLINPTPDHIREVESQFEEALLLMQQLQHEFPSYIAGAAACSELRSEFEALCLRVRTLLTGARRIQWRRLRRMGSFLETYTPTGTSKTWIPSNADLDVEL